MTIYPFKKIDHFKARRLHLCFFLIYISHFSANAAIRPFESNLPHLQPVLAVVSGKVTDTKNAPLPGVTISDKISKKQAVSGIDGSYHIEAKPGDELEFTMVGFQSAIITAGQSLSLNVTLKESNNSLNEVVVVGFGVQKKIDLTGAVDQISGKQLQDRPVTNIGDALQGQIANLNITTNYAGGAPDAKKSINVRGFTGYGGQLASPLILVDGVETDINSINVNDIESISLLKDAASSAVYGSRAPNGVLVVTTKQGKKNQAASLSYSNNFSYSQPINVPTMVNSLEWANVYNEANINAGLAQYISNDQLTLIKAYIQDPKNTPDAVALSGATSWTGNANNDWFKIFLKPWSPSQQHNLSLDGGGDKTTYFIGLGSTDKNGLYNYQDDSYGRYNVRANITTDVNKFITLSVKTSFSQENDSYPYNGGSNTGSNWFHQIARLFPTTPLIDPNGGYDQNSYVPQFEQGGSNNSRTNQSRISGDIIIRPLKGWNITGHYNYDYSSYNITSTILPFNYSTPANPQTSSNTISSVSETYSLTNYYNYNFFSSYEHEINGHYFKVQVGEQTEKKSYSNLNGFNQYLYSASIPSLYLTSGTTPSTTDQGAYNWATNSVIGRINYNYKEKYLLEGNANYMGTSLFPQNSRYHMFTSVSGGWNISGEDFFENIKKKINNLKFRVSYGGLGDISSFLTSGNYYPYLATLATGSSTSSQWIFTPGTGGRLPSVSNPSSLVSPTLTWAKPSMLDIGVDMDFLTDFDLTADWYRKNITDQFGPSNTYPGPLGVTPPTVNNSASVTWGWDLTASWKHKFGDFRVNARGTLSHYAGKITQYSGNPLKLINQPYVGEQLGTIWGFKTLGKFQSTDQVKNSPSQAALNSSGWFPGDIQYADLNGDNKITYGSGTAANPGDEEIIGNTTPKFFYGFSTGAGWKGFDVYLFIQGQGHADYAPTSNYFWGLTSVYQSTITPKIEDRWSPTNPNGYFPRLDINNSAKDQLVQSGYLLNTAYMRLKNIQLSYTVPNSLTEKYHIYGLKIYTSVDNVATFSGVFKHQYIDPELLQSDEKIYPLQRTYSFGVQVNVK
jgi:TonB-linked SusC/RagA family outer membrane protein